jgi:hypothetical protein
VKENPNSIQNGTDVPINILIAKPIMERVKINNKAINQFWIL